MENRPIGEECPTNEFKQGAPKGKCWGDGHWMCKHCLHYSEDFKRLGQDFIDFAHRIQGEVLIVHCA